MRRKKSQKTFSWALICLLGQICLPKMRQPFISSLDLDLNTSLIIIELSSGHACFLLSNALELYCRALPLSTEKSLAMYPCFALIARFFWFLLVLTSPLAVGLSSFRGYCWRGGDGFIVAVWWSHFLHTEWISQLVNWSGFSFAYPMIENFRR